MLQKLLITVVLFLCSGALGLVFGQPVAPTKRSYITGDVLSIGDKKFVIGGKSGPVDIIIGEKSVFKKVSAENPNFAAATDAAIGDIVAGDKLTVSGVFAEDAKSIPALSVYFISKADLAAKAAKESGEWQRRGVMGKVTAVNAQTNQVTIETRTLTGTSNIVLTPKENAKFMRYAPDSIRFDEALASSLGDVKTGDMIRALGDKSADGLAFAAEQVVTGAFQTVAGTVKSIDVAKNEIVIKNLQTNKDVTVVIGDTSVLKRFPAEQAEALARMQAMAGGGARPMGGARPAGQGAEGRPAGGQQQTQGRAAGQGMPQGQGQGPGGRPGMGARPGGGIDEMLERSPSITVGDLKAGDIIALSSTKTADVERLKAIKLFAGVEPFLRAAQTSGGGRGRGGVETGFSIPGLDGIGFP